MPEYERHLFDQADLFWQTRRTYDNYDDRNTFFTVGEPIEVDAVLEDYEEFSWREYGFLVLPAKGHTFGSSTLIAEIDGQRIAFTGDLMSGGGVLYQLHAMEYMYAGLEGLAFTLQSIQALRRREPTLALPSHGEPITDVPGDIDRLERRITDCVRLGRGMHVVGIWSLPEANFLPELELIPLSRHLLWGGIWTCSNFYILLSESGKALFVDYGTSNLAHLHIHADHEGMESMRFVEHRLDALREDYGVSEVDVVIPTHIHDDHTCGIPYLQRFHDTKCWALDQVAQVIENPADWGEHPMCLSEANPCRSDIERRRVVHVGGVRVRDLSRSGSNGVPLGDRNKYRRPACCLHRRQLAGRRSDPGRGAARSPRTRRPSCETASSSTCTAVAQRSCVK